jgi:hypothetical protein
VWKAQATFSTDDNGCVDVATQAPRAGNYRDVDVMSLFWSPFQNGLISTIEKHSSLPLDWNGLYDSCFHSFPKHCCTSKRCTATRTATPANFSDKQ